MLYENKNPTDGRTTDGHAAATEQSLLLFRVVSIIISIRYVLEYHH